MNKLKLWRMERGLSQYELAEAAQIARWKIQLLELGIQAPSKDEYGRLLGALGVNSSELKQEKGGGQ
jgi:transcriptional regulator with XRE-family HTH domain